VAEPHLDHPGEISWYAGRGPAPVLGACDHTCGHEHQSVIAWGPTYERYELAQCDVPDGCAGRCRAWIDERGRTTTARLRVDVPEDGRLAKIGGECRG
jgi:hypothetical protein